MTTMFSDATPHASSRLVAWLGMVGLVAIATAYGCLGDSAAFLAGYLSGWWYWLGLSLGALCLQAIHTLTGGAWGDALRPALVRARSWLPMLALAAIPWLANAGRLYPWTHGARLPDQGWWLAQPFFTLRAVGYIALWLWLSRPGEMREGRVARTLIAYGFSLTLAAIDWLMALQPDWHATGFGLLAGTGQLLAATALGAAVVAGDARPPVRRDLGNLLLACVMLWAYLAYTQYLIVWAENLPAEIGWYLPRLHSAWRWMALILVVGHGAIPLAALLLRRVKGAAAGLRTVALWLLAMHLFDVVWLILPSQAATAGGAGLGWAIAWAVLLALPLDWRRRVHA